MRLLFFIVYQNFFDYASKNLLFYLTGCLLFDRLVISEVGAGRSLELVPEAAQVPYRELLAHASGSGGFRTAYTYDFAGNVLT